ncbi:MAG: NAD(+)/NADH kinase [Bacteroidales bacterium]|nr:NAD(+)/NADH kinase [Bacteroidales bacterium]
MRVAIHTKNKTAEHENGRIELVSALKKQGIEVVENWKTGVPIDMMISIGGDGTLLNAVHQIGREGIPVVGINFGHLGFLTTAGRNDIDKLALCLKEGRYSIEQRTMLEVGVYADGELRSLNALNEVYLHRCEESPLLHTQVEVDGERVATYAADGLIVATPTGSTAYSLSCGGPILAPGSGSLVLTPIAAHTLTQRPVILSDNVRLRLQDEERDVHFTLGVDSYVCRLGGDSVIEVHKANYSTKLVRLEKQNFFSAIREKLMWGL